VFIDQIEAAADIERSVGAMCDALPYPVSALCASFIGQRVERIISDIRAGIGGFDICGKLNLCDATTLKKSRVAVKAPSARRTRRAIPGAASAEMFDSAVHFVAELRKYDYPAAEIESSVAELCGAFVFPISTACRSLVLPNLNGLIESLDSGLTGEDVVKRFGMAARGRRARNREAVWRLPDGAVCDICQSVVDLVVQLVLEDVVESDVEALVNQLCLELPYPLGGLCEAFVDQFIDEIIGEVEAGIEQFEICVKVGLCVPQDARRPVCLKNFVRKSLLRAKPSGVLCDVCQDFIQVIEKLVLEGIAEDVIIDIADGICDLLPMPERSFCISVVDREIEDIIDWIVQGIDALNICGNLGFCSTPPQP
jgi:hypothetical protein